MTIQNIVLKTFGIFLIVEGIISIAYSHDQQNISQAGRVARIGIGIVLVTIKF